MSSFFELRIYKVFPKKMNAWIKFMEETIIPFQVSKGMVIHGSFILDSTDQFISENGNRVMKSQPDGNTYVWIRRFKNSEQKARLYKEVYESNEWITNIAPKVAELIDRNAIIVHNMTASELSIMK